MHVYGVPYGGHTLIRNPPESINNLSSSYLYPDCASQSERLPAALNAAHVNLRKQQCIQHKHTLINSMIYILDAFAQFVSYSIVRTQRSVILIMY